MEGSDYDKVRMRIDKVRPIVDSDVRMPTPAPDPVVNDNRPVAETEKDDWSAAVDEKMGGPSTDIDQPQSDRTARCEPMEEPEWAVLEAGLIRWAELEEEVDRLGAESERTVLLGYDPEIVRLRDKVRVWWFDKAELDGQPEEQLEREVHPEVDLTAGDNLGSDSHVTD